MDDLWSVKKAMKVYGDIQHLEKHGCWRIDIPKWAVEIAEPLGGFIQIGLPGVLFIAYKKCADTFIDEYIRAGRK